MVSGEHPFKQKPPPTDQEPPMKRPTSRQHLKMADLLGEKAKKAAGVKKKRLKSLELAHRLRAKQIAADNDLYAKALPYLRAGVAHFADKRADLPAMVRALVKHLASVGMDADGIRNMKPHIRRFIEEYNPTRTRSMHQAAARYWNQIAESQPLKTEWAQQMFPLPQEDMDLALENEEKRLLRETNNPVLVSAYLKIMPLLWENAAISNYLKDNPRLRIAMPPLQSIPEALMVASRDFQLTMRELMKLGEMLKELPTPNTALRVANSIISDYRVSARKQLLLPRIAEALFHPSFDPETLLRVIADTDNTTMELTSAEHNFGRRFTHKNIVEPNYALRFWNKLDAMLATPLNIGQAMGLDGITIRIDCRTPAGSANFEVWSPEPKTHAGRLVGLIYDLAWEVSSAASAVQCLKRLQGYLPRGTTGLDH